MDDTLSCPICGNKLKTMHLPNKLLHGVGKTANYAERRCSDGHNHIVSFWTDKETKQVDLLKISLKPNYTRFLEIDYINQKCRITCQKDGEYEYIEIPKMIEPDFPDLVKLKERVGLYVVFS
jgi:hypothetical protein